MTALSTGYDPKTFESPLYAQRESSGVFAPAGDGPAYTILLPPPNVTGTLPMGHAFQHTLMDALGRHPPVRGFRQLWPRGRDPRSDERPGGKGGASRGRHRGALVP